ncbi:MAG: cyclase family protein [Pirellulales bacterium]
MVRGLAGSHPVGGMTYGASDDQAAFIMDKPVHIRDICATIYHLLGIDPEMPVYDRADRRSAGRAANPRSLGMKRITQSNCDSNGWGNMQRRRFQTGRGTIGGLLTLLLVAAPLAALAGETAQQTRFVDHSLLVAPDYPCTWPTYPFPRFQLTRQRTIGPDSAYNIDVLLIDGNTGTQMDVPPHSVARPELKREKSGQFGLAYTDKIEAWQFGGEACVVDVRDLLDMAPNGASPLITPDRVERFEQHHRGLRFGDVVLFRSDYTDRYYRPFPEGNRFLADALDRKAPAFPDPNPACMELLAKRGVMTLGTDSASMGPLPDLGEPTHYAGLKHGMIWTESATNLGALPATGAFYCMLGPKHQGGPYGATRAFSIVGSELPRRLIESTKNKRAIDLSPTLAANLPVTTPGVGAGQHRQAYLKVDFLYSEYLDMWHHAHLMDSMAGTHLVPPSYALPPLGVKPQYAPEVRGWLAEYEERYGPRGESSMTTEQVPLDWTCGPVRVIDVRSLVGSTSAKDWPLSPEITPALVQANEKQHGDLQPGDVVLFQTGHLDRTFQPRPHDANVWSGPLLGKSEGWPAPGPDAIVYLKSKGIRCVASDAPDLGGVDQKRALMTYWALGSREMVGVEFLHHVGQVPADGYFLFAPLKIRDCHGGPGRAIVLY